MSNRFHSKWHRRNHHTYGNGSNPDAGHDPIASQQQPFLGEFVLSGSLSAVAPLSAYAAFLYTDNTALCAYAGIRGALIHSEGYLGAEIWSTKSTAISSYAPKVSIEAASPMRALSAFGGYIAGEFYSSIRAISANAQFVGIDVYSPRRALSALGGQIALEAVSPMRALSAFGGYVGLDVYSNSRAISAYGQIVGGEFYSPRRALSAYGGQIGIETFSPNWGLSAWGGYVGVESYSNNRAVSAYGQIVGGEFYSPRRALSAWGGTVGLDVSSPYWGVSAYGGLMAIGAYSDNVALSGYGALTGLKIEGGTVGGMFHSPFISLSTGGGGINVFNSRTGIYKTPEDYYGLSQRGQVVLDVGGDVWINGSTTITGDLSALGSISYLDTKVQITSSLLVNNAGTDAATTIIQTGAQPILQCFDQDIDAPHTKAALMVDGASNGWIGFGVNTPTAPFNIVKDNSASELGSSDQPHVRIYDGTTNKIIIGTYGTNNSGSNPGAATNPYIGTENAAPFDIYTNNQQRISVLSNGNVGVNATTPTAKMAILGDSNGTTALSAWGSAYGAIIAGGITNINYDGGGSTYINTNNTVATNVGIGNTSTTLTTLGVTTINNNAGTNTTDIATGTTTGTVNIATGQGSINVGNNTVGVTTTLNGATINVNGTSVNIGTASTSTLNIGTQTGLATTQGNSTGNHTLNSNNLTAPNQVVGSDSSVLTRSAGDTRYRPTVYNNTLSSANSTTTLANTVGGITLEANTTYEVTAVAVIGVVGNFPGSPSSPDIGSKVAFEGDGTLTFVHYFMDEMSYTSTSPTSPTNTTYSGAPNSSSMSANTTTITSSSGATNYHRRRMTLRTGTGGTLYLKNAVKTAGGTNNSTPTTGSFIFARKIV